MNSNGRQAQNTVLFPVTALSTLPPFTNTHSLGVVENKNNVLFTVLSLGFGIYKTSIEAAFLSIHFDNYMWQLLSMDKLILQN